MARSGKSRPPGPRASARPRSRPLPPEPPTTRRLPRLDTLEGETETRTSQTAIKVAAPATACNAILTVLTGLSAGRIFSVGFDDLTVGRSHDCEVRLDDQGISRRHCRFRRAEDDSCFVEDLGSTNGTYVNGKRIEGVRLDPGDRVQIGADVVVRFSFTDETEEVLAKRLYESSTRDPLTHAFTRKYFDERLSSEVAYASRHETPFGVILFDLDHFKAINDRHGHAAGDAVLRGVSRRIENLIRGEDVFARYGGEEFAILVRGIEGKNMEQFAERVRKSTARGVVDFKGRKIEVTVSVGVAMLDEVTGTNAVSEILALADRRVYQAKAGGRNRTVCR
jgi:diguanylate cyclase (GGDEF)-like protein